MHTSIRLSVLAVLSLSSALADPAPLTCTKKLGESDVVVYRVMVACAERPHFSVEDGTSSFHFDSSNLQDASVSSAFCSNHPDHPEIVEADVQSQAVHYGVSSRRFTGQVFGQTRIFNGTGAGTVSSELDFLENEKSDLLEFTFEQSGQTARVFSFDFANECQQ